MIVYVEQSRFQSHAVCSNDIEVCSNTYDQLVKDFVMCSVIITDRRYIAIRRVCLFVGWLVCSFVRYPAIAALAGRRPMGGRSVCTGVAGSWRRFAPYERFFHKYEKG